MRDKIEAIERCFEHYAMGGSEHDYYEVGVAIRHAIAACDETCEWHRVSICDKRGFGDGWRPDCCTHSWFDLGRGAMTYCPHCGRKIKDAAAPAAENGETK